MPLTDLFIKDSTYDAEYRVYRSGTRTYRTVHIGNRQGSVRFDIGDGAEIDYKHGSSTIHYTRNELLANVSQGIPFDSGAELDPIMNAGTVPTRTGYTFKGWITTVYASDSRTYAIDNYKFDGGQAYLPSPETELIVRAVWAINGTDVIDVEHYDQLFWKTDDDKSRDVTFELHADLDASRSDAVALKSFGRTGKTTIYMAGHTLHVYEDINGFVDENYESEYEILGYGHTSDPYLTTDTGSIVYEGLIAKENPLVVAKSLKLQRMDIKDFEMNDVLIDTSKSTDTTGTTLTLDTVEFSNNIRLTIKARSNQIHFDTIGFIDNSVKQSGSSLYAREEYPLVYLTTPSNANDGIIDHATFGDNSYIYSYIMTEQSMASYEQKVIIRNSDFAIGKANVAEKGPSNPVIGGNYSSIIKSLHNVNNSDIRGIVELDNVRFDTSNNKFYGSIVDAYETDLIIKNTNIDNVTAVLNLITQEALRKKAVLIATNSTFTNNTLSNKNFGQLILRRKSKEATDKFTNVRIENNHTMFALYSLDTTTNYPAPPSYEFGGEIIVRNNRYSATQNASGDIYLTSFDSETNKENVIKFSASMPIASTSDITFYRPTTITNGSLIAYNTWLPAVHDHATERIFSMIDSSRNSEYVIYRDEDSLKVARSNTDNYFKTIEFDVNDGGDGIANPDDVIDVQYVADGTYVDEPADPVNAAGHKFLGWYIKDKDVANKYIKYDFTSKTDDYKVYGATRSVLYAKWDKEIKLSIWSNSGGHPASDPTKDFGNASPSKVVYTLKMGNKISDVTDPSKIKAYVIKADGSVVENPTWTTATGFTRDGLNATGIFDENGWNDGANNEDWGNRWILDQSEWLIDEDLSTVDPTSVLFRMGNLYVAWEGAEYNITYDLNKSDGTTTPTVDLTGKTTTGKFNSLIGTDEDSLPTPARDGYRFLTWHSASESDFSYDNVVVGGETIYSWTKDMTFYARWTPNNYNVVYKVQDGEVADGNMADSTFAFDATTSLARNQYTVSGKDFMYWVSTDSTTGTIHTYRDGEEKRFNLATKSGVDVILEARFEPQVREISFDLNFVTGQTTRATISQATMSVTYGKKFGNIPVPTRPGYT